MRMSALRRRVALWLCPELGAVPIAPVPAAAGGCALMTDEDVAALIRAFAAARGCSESYAAKLAAGSGDTLERIARGNTLTIARAHRIVAAIARLWPDGQPMPPVVAAAQLTGRAP